MSALVAPLSPLLGNVYLHYVLEAWFERVLPLLGGTATLRGLPRNQVSKLESQPGREHLRQRDSHAR